MNVRPGPSKRSCSDDILSSRSKRRSKNSSLEESERSSEETVYSQCYEEQKASDTRRSSNLSNLDLKQKCEYIRKPVTKTLPIQTPAQESWLLQSRTFDDQLPNSEEELFQEEANRTERRSFQDSPPVITKYRYVPEHLLNISGTPSVSLLRSIASTPDFFNDQLSILSRGNPIISLHHRAAGLSTRPLFKSVRDSVKLATHNNDNIPSDREATSTWTSEGTLKIIEFTKCQGLLVPAPSDPLEAFHLFLDNEILNRIVHETNKNAERVMQQPGVTEKSRITYWKELTRSELLTFIGLLLHTGTIRLHRLNDYWKTHWLFNIPCFGQHMSRNRFMLILRCLHFTSESSEQDRWGEIRPIMEHFNKKMHEIYCPGKQLFLDESMVLWRGRLIFRQYMKNKRHKYGIKLFVLAEPDGTVLKFQINCGAGDEISGVGHTQKIVLKLLEEKLNSGHSVYMDNYYNSYDLAVKLLDYQTYCTGILSKNRKGNPVDLDCVTLQKGENRSLFLNCVHIGKWKDKKYVFYISTEHDNEMLEVTDKRGQVTVKPSAIVHYNKFMSGVDLEDQLLPCYPCENKTMRWYKKIFIHVLQMSLSNAFHLYNKFSANKIMNLYDFRLSILEKLLPKPPVQKKTLCVKHELSKIENVKIRKKKEGNRTRIIKEVVRKECKGCREKKKRVATLYECKGCDGSPGYCTQCFCDVHL